MCTSHGRNMRNVKKNHNSSKTEPKDIEMVEMLGKELKNLLLKMIIDLKEDANKEMNEVKKSIQDLDEESYNLDKKSGKELRFCKNPNRNLGKEKLCKSNKNTVESITNNLDQVEERLSRIEDKVKGMFHSSCSKEKKKQPWP
jgi:hypothetical protein